MMAFTLFEGLPVGLRSAVGVRESRRESVQATVRHTWNGRARILKPSFARKWDVSLSNDGSNVWPPDVDRLVPGASVVLYSTTWWSVSLAAGETIAVLERDPVPGTVHARDAVDEKREIDCAVAGRNVSIFGRGGRTRVWYRPILRCLVVSFEDGGSMTGDGQSWTLELTEAFAP